METLKITAGRGMQGRATTLRMFGEPAAGVSSLTAQSDTRRGGGGAEAVVTGVVPKIGNYQELESPPGIGLPGRVLPLLGRCLDSLLHDPTHITAPVENPFQDDLVPAILVIDDTGRAADDPEAQVPVPGGPGGLGSGFGMAEQQPQRGFHTRPGLFRRVLTVADPSFLELVGTTKSDEQLELDMDQSKRNYLQPKEGTAAAKIGAGLFTAKQ